MKPRVILMLVALAVTLVVVGEAFAQRNPNVAETSANEQRVALVIGNSAYKESPLANPVNDAADVARALGALGFKVTLRTNASRRQMEEAIRELGSALQRGGVGLFYYAGHGIQSRGANYLVPVAASIQSEADLRYEAVDANMVLSQMDEAGNRVNIVVLDACRDNPFARSFRSAARGLAQLEAAKGSFIAFATAPGSVAADGSGRNSIYTKHLLASLTQSDSDIDKVFRRVAAQVSRETGGKQVPWVSSSLTGDFFFRSGQGAQVPVPVQSAEEIEQEYWNIIKDSRDVKDFESYEKQYPRGRFVALARQKAKSLEVVPVVVPPPPAKKIGDVCFMNGNSYPRRIIIKSRNSNFKTELLIGLAQFGQRNAGCIHELEIGIYVCEVYTTYSQTMIENFEIRVTEGRLNYNLAVNHYN